MLSVSILRSLSLTWRGFQVIFPAGLCAIMAYPIQAYADTQTFDLIEAAPGIYVHQGVHEDANPDNRGDIANIGFIVGDETVAVIDTGGTYKLGQRLRTALRTITDMPIGYVINTHIHPDHIFGNAAFADDQPVYVGHARLGPAMEATAPYYIPQLTRAVGAEEAAGSIMVPPTRIVRTDTPIQIDLGNRILELRAWPVHHSPTDLTIFDQKTRTLWAGSVFVERIPSITGSLPGYIEVLEEMKTIQALRVIPGNGPAPAPWPQAAEPMLRYLKTLADGIRAVLARGGDINEAVATVGHSEKDYWLLFDDYHGGNITTGFAELEWED